MSQERTPCVSIIMPSYRVSQYIGEAVESALAQTFKDFEIVVVNDGSPDTPELERVLAPYMDRIVYIKQENRGCSGARNTAIRAARGRYLALLDPDDIWEPNYLEVQVGMLERHPSVDLVYPNATIFGDLPDSGRLFMDLSPSKGEVTFESLVSQKCNVMISVTARRDALIRAGLFDESLLSAEDFDMWLRLVHSGGRISYHRQPLVRYRRRRGSLSSDPAWMCRNVLKVFQKMEETLDLSPREREAVARQRVRFRALLSLYEGKKAFFKGEVKAALENLTRANEFFKSGKLRLACFLLRASPQLLLRAYHIRDRFIIGADTKY
ncbi:MAG TPA: glycosyltransferase family A protein [Blastocatellia bacterium]|nr:glycosyltransferase family A protein [Blastocatellia bacterium]